MTLPNETLKYPDRKLRICVTDLFFVIYYAHKRTCTEYRKAQGLMESSVDPTETNADGITVIINIALDFYLQSICQSRYKTQQFYVIVCI